MKLATQLVHKTKSNKQKHNTICVGQKVCHMSMFNSTSIGEWEYHYRQVKYILFSLPLASYGPGIFVLICQTPFFELFTSLFLLFPKLELIYLLFSDNINCIYILSNLVISNWIIQSKHTVRS